MLIDGANYFAAARSAMIKAHHSILIAGWDIHSQTRLVGPPGKADDGYPETFAEFLTALVEERPQLDIRLLLWDFSLLYAAERDPFPTMSLRWNTPHNIRFCLDDCVPIGSSQHQKLVVIDDAIAFSGGLDLTIRRWDTSSHRPNDPLRVDPNGEPYDRSTMCRCWSTARPPRHCRSFSRALAMRRLRKRAEGARPTTIPGPKAWRRICAMSISALRARSRVMTTRSKRRKSNSCFSTVSTRPNARFISKISFSPRRVSRSGWPSA